MSTLMLLRLSPLTSEEEARLPEGCFPVPESSSVLARADVNLPLRELFQLAVKMARAVPDAEFVFHESTAPGARKARAARPSRRRRPKARFLAIGLAPSPWPRPPLLPRPPSRRSARRLS